VPDAELDAVLGAGDGIIAGSKVQWATLRFTPERARWVSVKTWHPKQRGCFEDNQLTTAHRFAVCKLHFELSNRRLHCHG
jgi:hypothetical protein